MVVSIVEYLFDLLVWVWFWVIVNIDNWLMSDILMSFEMYCLVEVFGYGWSDLVCFIVNVMKFVFILFD